MTGLFVVQFRNYIGGKNSTLGRGFNYHGMAKFIELIVSEEFEIKKELVNVDVIGRIYPNPQSRSKSIVELNYQSVNNSPVYLEVDMAYETLRSSLMI
jgi:hypothetical protein